MKMKIAFANIVIAGIIIGVFIVFNHELKNPAAAPKPGPAAKPPTIPVTAAKPVVQARNTLTTTVSARTEQSRPAKPLVAAKSGSQPLKINGYIVQDPDARLALSFVGTDPDAEAYWAQAINDPNLPTEERKDLIEDLNEDGLANPHQPTAEDMPIIAYRIQMIQQMAPDAMDHVNADAFAEAYKDLVNLYNGLPAN
ncbi:MAG TPA: hypothetical protein VH280_16690 [Verrucomicrobiae bacterium]|jgi:hypothetical protein|nr:hypothetical protein [Verrucomicrobiae bacterium]